VRIASRGAKPPFVQIRATRSCSVGPVSATDASQPFAGWDDGLRTELEANTSNASVLEHLDSANPPLPLATTAAW
jgi:hypothetical protein